MPKVVTILIDIGQSMDHPILQGQGSGSVLDNAKSIVGEFLKALSDGDFVNIIMFGSAANALSPTMVIALTLLFLFRCFTSIAGSFITEISPQSIGSLLLTLRIV